MPPGLVRRGWDRRLAARFPPNPYVQRLVRAARAMGIAFEPSPLPEQWMYHPGRRAILIWGPDLSHQSLSYLVVIMAHELGHALDFERRRCAAAMLGHGQVSGHELEMEQAACVEGFLLLKRLAIPVSLRQYLMMLEPPLAGRVQADLEARLCCLLDRWGPAFARAAATRSVPGVALPPVA
ncbi:hypothetical protein [Geochorda subterranea]|uniref:IrrE N-terminal-like domain-containing protein n=1 Tax=Geochorda subterranea TaxID=3109564 RepID=A0ABZ1BNF1_9FIRM|nr:hypothetical protein [Limnochorda sp. LNt]WRP14204.1 hypothetical protein VLY81_12385 [Limnochorda sp. LNt]